MDESLKEQMTKQSWVREGNGRISIGGVPIMESNMPNLTDYKLPNPTHYELPNLTMIVSACAKLVMISTGPGNCCQRLIVLD